MLRSLIGPLRCSKEDSSQRRVTPAINTTEANELVGTIHDRMPGNDSPEFRDPIDP